MHLIPHFFMNFEKKITKKLIEHINNYLKLLNFRLIQIYKTSIKWSNFEK